MGWSTFIPMAVFFAITLGVWAALSMVADRPINADERLKRVLNPNAARPDSSALSRQQDMLQAKFAEAAKRLGKSLKPTDEVALGKLR
jgi:tight adherence protein C